MNSSVATGTWNLFLTSDSSGDNVEITTLKWKWINAPIREKSQLPLAVISYKDSCIESKSEADKGRQKGEPTRWCHSLSCAAGIKRRRRVHSSVLEILLAASWTACAFSSGLVACTHQIYLKHKVLSLAESKALSRLMTVKHGVVTREHCKR